MMLFLLVCQRHWLVQRHGRLVSTWKGNMQFAFQTSRGLICTLISRAQSLEMAFSTKDDEFQLEHMKLVRMLSNVMSIGSFFWLAHVSSPMPVFRHSKNLVASSSQATIHGICLVMHTSRLPATWVPWWGYARLFVDICKLSSPRTPSSRCVFDATMFNYYTWRQTKNFGVNQIDQWALKWAG